MCGMWPDKKYHGILFFGMRLAKMDSTNVRNATRQKISGFGFCSQLPVSNSEMLGDFHVDVTRWRENASRSKSAVFDMRHATCDMRHATVEKSFLAFALLPRSRCISRYFDNIFVPKKDPYYDLNTIRCSICHIIMVFTTTPPRRQRQRVSVFDHFCDRVRYSKWWQWTIQNN